MGTKELSYVAIGTLMVSIIVSIVKLRPRLSVLQKVVMNHARKAIFAEGLKESSGLRINFNTKPIGLSDTSNSSMPYLFILVFLAVIVFTSPDNNNDFRAVLNVILAAAGIVIMVGFKFTEFVIQTIEQEARYLAELIDYVEGDDEEEDDLDEDDEDE